MMMRKKKRTRKPLDPVASFEMPESGYSKYEELMRGMNAEQKWSQSPLSDACRRIDGVVPRSVELEREAQKVYVDAGWAKVDELPIVYIIEYPENESHDFVHEVVQAFADAGWRRVDPEE